MKDLPKIHTLIPGQNPIPLVAYYPQFEGYYPTCELATKQWFVANATADWWYIDAGANIGYFSILFSKLSPNGRVFAFEPTSSAELMKKNLVYNEVYNVEIVRQALGSFSGTFKDDIYRVWGEAPERQEYAFTTIDQFVKTRKPTRIDCLKIDVDSFDLEVLFGAEEVLREWDPFVVVELNHALAKRSFSNMEALEWLYDQGYRESLVLDFDNFVLKRACKTRTMSTQKTFQITFGPKLIEEPIDTRDSRKLHEVSDVIGSKPTLHAGQLTRDATNAIPFIVAAKTDAAPWSYCVSFALAREKMKFWPRDEELIVIVHAVVHEGRLGVGVVTSDFSTLVGRERFLSPVSGEQRLQIVVETPTAAGHLVFRNCTTSPSPTAFKVLSIDCFYRKMPSTQIDVLDPNVNSISISLLTQVINSAREHRGDSLMPDLMTDQDLAIEIVDDYRLGEALGYFESFKPEKETRTRALVDWRMEVDDAPILAYLYQNHRPTRHLEIGTWEGFGAALCASSCDAIIWTVNLPTGEKLKDGSPAYSEVQLLDGQPRQIQTDSGDRIGRFYREAGYTHRVHQILEDSRTWDTSEFCEGFFDSIMIDGGHATEIVKSDTQKFIPFLRPGGLFIWHDFCPDFNVLKTNDAPLGVAEAIARYWANWAPNFKRAFWIRKSHILLGVK